MQNEDKQKLKYAARPSICCMPEKKMYIDPWRGLEIGS